MFLFCLVLWCMYSYYHLVPLICCYCSMGYLSDSVDWVLYRRCCVSLYFIIWWGSILLNSQTWCPGLNHSVKLHTLHESVVPAGVSVLLGLCNPARWGRGEPAKPGLLYPLVWIPCCDIVSEVLGSWSRVDSIAGNLESWVTAVIDMTRIDP
jgi:hypothetical protein